MKITTKRPLAAGQAQRTHTQAGFQQQHLCLDGGSVRKWRYFFEWHMNEKQWPLGAGQAHRTQQKAGLQQQHLYLDVGLWGSEREFFKGDLNESNNDDWSPAKQAYTTTGWLSTAKSLFGRWNYEGAKQFAFFPPKRLGRRATTTWRHTNTAYKTIGWFHLTVKLFGSRTLNRRKGDNDEEQWPLDAHKAQNRRQMFGFSH